MEQTNTLRKPNKIPFCQQLDKGNKKSEMRKQDKPSSARRPMKIDDFVEMISCMRVRSELIARYTYVAYFYFSILHYSLS